MNALVFAWRSLIRQPARAVLGIVGVAAVCALLFDMLLLSRGLVLSMQDLLEQVGFAIRVTATQSLPGSGPRIRGASQVAAAIAALPEVAEAVPLVFGDAEVTSPDRARPLLISFFAADASTRRPWTIVEGRDLAGGVGLTGQVLLNRRLADVLGRRPGDTVTLRASCGGGPSAVPPLVLEVAGIATFPFDDPTQMTAASTLRDAARACGGDNQDEADLLLVALSPRGDPDEVREAIRRLRPDLYALTNDEVVARLQQAEFSYFRQISTVLDRSDAVVRRSPDYRAPDRFGQPAARRDRQPFARWVSLDAASSPTSFVKPPSSSASAVRLPCRSAWRSPRGSTGF